MNKRLSLGLVYKCDKVVTEEKGWREEEEHIVGTLQILHAG